ncbi:ATP-binding cassette domain-containing protein [Phyllobacterium sp. 0TCS1.6C]|uniref:ABC transporter ATP-binding protein n=1 Tax=unclassified Phyllobacterium TaxID=2638441 RepID=UPI00226428A8|nr:MULTISPECIES: ABC transporter ATP-binding protein [unclassified Phyllobacterium]MCX8278937.1 ATP-binding cassette domain-containing protein [Phyllobacterium sp. 0TCS1.6C]MCX8293721.1 ATP-binding cassette domain-containing protein [Phyllobacterium sp. 0TCS1.6A]
MLKINELTIGFGEKPSVLTGISLDVADGESVLICGAAGSGKTTLLSAAAGIIPHLIRPGTISGQIELNGTPFSAVGKKVLYASVNIVFQNVEDQLWDLSVEDLIAFPLENRGVQKSEIRQRIGELSGQLQLDSLRGRRVLTLSGGERRMAAIAAAMAARPRLLVLDEPTTGLDPSARSRLVETLLELRTEIPMLLIADQDAVSLAPLADRIGLLKDGRLSKPLSSASMMRGSESWLSAGVLPPSRMKKRRDAAAKGETLIEVAKLKSSLTRSDGKHVLQDVSFQLQAGEIVGLIGRNGAGKTTLFQSVLGLSKVVDGVVNIDRANAGHWTPAQRARRVGYLPQNMRRILFNLTVLDEVIFAATGSTKPNRDAAVIDNAMLSLAKYGLADHAGDNPFALSSRAQAMLGLACVESTGCSLAILDEPLLARDIEGRRMLDIFLDDLVKQGRAALIISHDLELIDDIAERTLILDEGRMVFDGETSEVWTSDAFRKLGWMPPRPVLEHA